MVDSRLVYSTQTGRFCPEFHHPATQCACKGQKKPSSVRVARDGMIRIGREVKGRKGKTVTTISGFEKDPGDIKQIASQLKSLCATGGSVKNGMIVIQGDHRQPIKAALEKQGFKVKLAGG
jgi:translation initiation factor 1